jgi:hypothetical protein
MNAKVQAAETASTRIADNPKSHRFTGISLPSFSLANCAII